ncbi:hypothetical protein BN6_20420 [Saccharothrix espanaensis DSM 44229]|uniref:Uncharacterized protein n=1 Tax=Saccharothrix espanaensis (strain ATCC 51144 / DSM 44229 / JCM 9112 / NBRC 15066 / NRRL 15764) TaxID=1179773 RepID=K0JX72_SACES|nr:hypothetical protein BN6_20420 [Saccharothrix espanaensis DSM 44229]
MPADNLIRAGEKHERDEARISTRDVKRSRDGCNPQCRRLTRHDDRLCCSDWPTWP